MNHRHVKGDGSWWANDARGIPLARVCDDCFEKKMAKFRHEVMTDSHYESDEAIEEDY